MIDVSVTLDDKVPAALNKLSGTLYNDVVTQAIHPYLEKVKEKAKKEHRYKRRTGTLERAVNTEKTQNGGSVFIDDSIAPYGEFVHRGHGTWNADEFLYEAQDDELLDRMINNVIDRSIKEAGL